MAKVVTIQRSQHKSQRNAKAKTDADSAFLSRWQLPCAALAVVAALTCLGGAVLHARGGGDELSPAQARAQMSHKIDSMKAPRSGFAKVASGTVPSQPYAAQ